MEMFTGIFFIVVAVWLITVGGFFTTASNLKSAVAFKVVPVAIGFASMFLALNHYGFIVQLG